MDSNDINTGLSLISKDFQVDLKEAGLPSGKEITEEKAFAFLLKLVEHLMTHDFNRLLNSLYRIDVPEQKLKVALTQSENPAQTITQMIWDREMEKVATRKHYAKG